MRYHLFSSKDDFNQEANQRKDEVPAYHLLYNKFDQVQDALLNAIQEGDSPHNAYQGKEVTKFI